MSDVNIPLLRKAVEWAEAEAERENGQWWQSAAYLSPQERVDYGIADSTDCGSAYCIAGYIAHVVTGYENPYEAPEIKNDQTLCDFAANQIGVDRYAAVALWDFSNTIEEVRAAAEELAGERL